MRWKHNNGVFTRPGVARANFWWEFMLTWVLKDELEMSDTKQKMVSQLFLNTFLLFFPTNFESKTCLWEEREAVNE